MTSNTGKVKNHKKKFQSLNSKGARAHRKEFIETSYINGVVNDFGDQVIRPLNKDEISWLDKFYKEFIHSTFVTDSESILLFKKAKALTKKKENVIFFNKNGFFPEHVQQSIDAFNKKSKELGNLACDFWQQREINSDDYKRRYDIQNNCTKGVQLESFEDSQSIVNLDEYSNTKIEDLITESED
jgi:hypothetical protein